MPMQEPQSSLGPVTVTRLKITRIISGGQTGADMGGLLAARECGIATGGWAPKGWRTEAGPNTELAGYGLKECYSSNYNTRTTLNVMESCATIIFGVDSTGSLLTKSLCETNSKPWIWIRPVDMLHLTGPSISQWRAIGEILPRLSEVCTLNVAGNRESVTPGIQEAVRDFLVKLLRRGGIR